MNSSKKLSLDSFRKEAISTLNLDSRIGGSLDAGTTPLCPAQTIYDVIMGDNDCH